MPTLADPYLAFLLHFGAGAVLLVLAVALVALVTPHRELTLIRAGNVAAAIAFAGLAIGVALPVAAAISHSVDLRDALVWGALSALVQAFAYLLSRALVAGVSRRIGEGDVAAGVFCAGLSIALGLLNAAAMTP
jgi:putative membrane protein